MGESNAPDENPPCGQPGHMRSIRPASEVGSRFVPCCDGTESNAPERIWTVSGAGGRSWGFVKDGPDMGSTETVELVELSRLREAEAAYDRVVAECDVLRAMLPVDDLVEAPRTEGEKAALWFSRAEALAAERDRVVAERDEAESALLESAWVLNALLAEHNKARARADRYREAARALARIATGEVSHDFMGRCPSGPGDGERDPSCPACRVLSEWDETRAALAEGEQPEGETATSGYEIEIEVMVPFDGMSGPERVAAARVVAALLSAVPGIAPGFSCGTSDRGVEVSFRPAAGVQSTTGQRQDSTADQVESVRLLAQQHGCYDAADWIVRMREVDAERHTYPLEVGEQSTTETGPVAWLIVWQDDIDPPVREVTLAADRARVAAQWGKRTTALYEHASPSTTETARKAGPRDEFERTMTPLGASTTETATGDEPLRITAEALRAVAWCEAVGPHPQSEAAFRHAVFFGWLVQDPCWQATPAGREALARHECEARDA